MGSFLWSIIHKISGHTKINLFVKQDLYSLVLRHSQVVHSPIANDLLKVSINDQNQKYISPKLLL